MALASAEKPDSQRLLDS